MVMASLGQPLAQAVQPVQWVWSAKWGKGRSSALTGASSGVWGRSSRAPSKTVSAILGTAIGVVIAAVAAMAFGKAAGITGYNVSDIEALNYVGQNTKIKIGELLFAGIIISALGAVMDVGMSIASTIQEIYETDKTLSMKRLFVSGINVGRDMMGTMTNTLIFAYVGGAMTTLVINYAYDLSYRQLANSYVIGIEIMQGLSVHPLRVSVFGFGGFPIRKDNCFFGRMSRSDVWIIQNDTHRME